MQAVAGGTKIGVNPLLGSLVNRQKKSLNDNSQRTAQQKKIDVIQRITNPAFAREEAKLRNELRKKTSLQTAQEMKVMLVMMQEAYEADRLAV